MNALKIVCGIVLIPVFLFCIYGALASLEPTEGSPIHTTWFIGYVGVGLGALIGAVGCVRAGLKSRGPGTRDPNS